jgi:hypothetical protein
LPKHFQAVSTPPASERNGDDAALFERPRALKTEPIKRGRSDDLVQDPGSGILEIDQGAASGMAASHHGIRNPFANFVAVLVRRNPLANVFQRRGHIGDGVLIKLCEHFFRIPNSIKGLLKSVKGSK